MTRSLRTALGIGVCGLMMALVGGPAAASPGDTHTVTGERVNLRSGPSDRASIRSTVRRGDELLELKQDGNWTGVRNMRTGEEGWVFTDLLRQRSTSTLSGGGPGSFARYSSGFDRLIGRVNEELGYSFADRVEAGENGLLRVTPTQEWLFNTSREAKIYAAMALYQMWKNHNNGRPVSLALGERGGSPITIEDAANGPIMDLPALVGSSR
ncbi:MAG TPA: SH3 domain-containing protein [Azospirillum sp.]|nr:SH3 domain-containing protein [Azospirillum sp.]